MNYLPIIEPIGSILQDDEFPADFSLALVRPTDAQVIVQERELLKTSNSENVRDIKTKPKKIRWMSSKNRDLDSNRHLATALGRH